MEQNENTSEKKLSFRESVLLYMRDLMCYLTGICLVFLLIFRVVVVSGTSMNMTLLDGDYLLLISNTFYHTPQNGDIVVISKRSFDDGAPIVKRVIATEGQTIDIDFEQGIVSVDGEALTENYILNPTLSGGGVEFPLTVAEGCVFVMGDNRGNSRDSRYPEIGMIDAREILGKAIFLFLPGTNGIDTYGLPREDRDFSRIGVIK